MTIYWFRGDIRLDIPFDWSADRLCYDVIDDLMMSVVSKNLIVTDSLSIKGFVTFWQMKNK